VRMYVVHMWSLTVTVLHIPLHNLGCHFIIIINSMIPIKFKENKYFNVNVDKIYLIQEVHRGKFYLKGIKFFC
jgi:hypothetical protein